MITQAGKEQVGAWAVQPLPIRLPALPLRSLSLGDSGTHTSVGRRWPSHEQPRAQRHRGAPTETCVGALTALLRA